jgi:hypothetical protein
VLVVETDVEEELEATELVVETDVEGAGVDVTVVLEDEQPARAAATATHAVAATPRRAHIGAILPSRQGRSSPVIQYPPLPLPNGGSRDRR